MLYTKPKSNKRNFIKNSLMEKIKGLNADTQLPTEKELCETFGVARMTIRKALSELAAEKLVYRIQGHGTFVGHHLKTKKNVFFIGNTRNWAEKPITDCQLTFMKLQNLAYAEKINFELLDIDANNKESVDFSTISRLNSDDYVFLNFNYLHTPDMYESLVKTKCKVVYKCYDTETWDIFAPFLKYWHTLYYDRVASIKKAIKYLKSRGRKRIALLSYVYNEAHPYIKGFKQGLVENNLHWEPILIQSTPNTIANAFKFCKNLLLLRKIYDFDALITSHDNIAIGAQQALAGMGVPCPEDIALLSMQDSKMLEDNLSPISAVIKPEERMFKQAIEVFASDTYQSGKIETFVGTVVERKTT